MEKLILSVPNMWADHHVLKVREVLTALDGVEDIYASSAWKHVVIHYDPVKLNGSAIAVALTGAGYGVDEAVQWESRPMGAPDPAWEELGVRVTKTNQRDLELSGDFRRY